MRCATARDFRFNGGLRIRLLMLFIASTLENPERCGHRNKEVAGNDHLRLVPGEGLPALAGGPPARPVHIQILSNRSGRDADAKLEEQFVGDSLLAPGRIVPILSRIISLRFFGSGMLDYQCRAKPNR